ncbi:MAG: hypothetical protein IPF66_04585 [Holophagales bacterium]|nr:hypothetical protein [Holophagales bacterium]
MKMTIRVFGTGSGATAGSVGSGAGCGATAGAAAGGVAGVGASWNRLVPEEDDLAPSTA